MGAVHQAGADSIGIQLLQKRMTKRCCRAVHKRNSKPPQEQEMVKRVLGKPPRIIKIEPSADRAIDKLVYELSRKGMIYGLNEEEIKIVEGV